MRNFQKLDASKLDASSDVLEIYSTASDQNQPRLALRREGIYVAISASYGPLEIALRPKYEDLIRVLGRLTTVDGLHTTREVGSDQAFLAIGLSPNNNLILRPTIIADANGHFSLNIEIT